ncbi:hypothetical protein CIPAW_11G086600 [Carya illinoinensis]|uniref:non-specific serine/threonine protein kinase n=1 Tax=Carya illinoinensis TaxID=32201 RepID=A0A8T1P1F7_CARIL|nr:hypothetical protein CIPAW_11G086600 [Carya illinoinensis]
MAIVSSKMVISFFLLVVVSVAGLRGDQLNPKCLHVKRCGNSGPPIHFPFRLNTQPEDCGYPHPGFTLSCINGTETQLQLPNLKFFVTKIDYESQTIRVSDPDNCLPKQFKQDISYEPFQSTNISPDNFALFSCHPPDRDPDGTFISCLGEPGQKRFPVTPGSDDTLQLNWDTPDCRRCANNQNCTLKRNGTGNETVCFPETRKDIKSKLVTAGFILGSIFLALAVCALYRLYRYDKLEKENQIRIQRFLEDYRNLKPTRYTYADLKRITNQFAEKLGQGAYGTVFKGKLSNEIYVAVKILNSSKGNGEEFINEVGTMGRIHHVNVVRMVGFCADGFRRALVFEFLPNDSLEKFISSADAKDRFLGWAKLQDIALGIAKGIEYLHQGCDQRILHFDIKPHNVLLDQNFNPKISDFGLAKLCAKDQSAVSMTTARGTMGYIAPEVFSRNFGNVSYKADVYSFGMLLLEAVGGRKTSDVTPENTGQIYFPEWIYNLLEEKEDLRLFIETDEDARIAKKLAIVGLWCIQWHPADRPSMKNVVQMLEGEGNNLTMPPNPFASAGSTRMINSTMPPRRLNQELEAIPE